MKCGNMQDAFRNTELTMCGIYGSLDLGQIGQPFAEPQQAVDALYHRGPDETGSWQGEGIFLGMRRLSIIDLTDGQQPIWNEDKRCCIVYNGELYNYQDLRPELLARGHRFRTHSDTEVILHAYEEWGLDALQRFNGMYAFAIWDGYAQRLLIARDRIGIKPLYYYRDEQRLVFASEIKAILADPSIPRDLNPQGLANFLAFGHAVAPATMYRNIYKLLPGHLMICQDGAVTVSEYWDVGQSAQAIQMADRSEAALVQEIRTLLSDAVRRQMVADVPVGAFLSGGVDSSAVVALMKQHATGPVKTFSLGFNAGSSYNELSAARRVADYLGTEHHELLVEHVDLVETLRTLVYHYDEPFGDSAGFPLYLLSRFARDHAKVVLVGDGGDELFGGYRRYAVDQWAAAYGYLPSILTQRFVPTLAERLPRLRRIKRTLTTLPIIDPARRYAAWLALFTPALQQELLQPDLLAAIGDYDPAWRYPELYGALNGKTASDHLNRLMYVDLKNWLVDMYMEKTDKATMAGSIEARLPILDHRLVELAFQIPGRYKVRGMTTKHIFKQAVSTLIPEDVLRRPKQGFAVPTEPWFRGELKDFSFDVLFDEAHTTAWLFPHASDRALVAGAS
ncbi:MAG: asparagine synthase (glutamine-hydrolyzing) [Caldilineaceae bacterium]